jgi:putative membrane protein
MFEQPHRLHPAAILINAGVYLVHAIKGLAFPLIALLASGGKSGGQFTVLMVGGFVALIGGLSLIGPVLHYFSTRFYIQDEALVISSGFVWRKRRTIPLARIQNVNVERTIWHRLLRAAAVKIETAAGRKTEGDLAALSLEDANKLQAVLLQRKGIDPAPVEDEKATPIYVLSTKQVLLAGMLGNRVVYIIAGILSVFQFDRSGEAFGPIMKYLEHLNPVTAILAGALGFVCLVIIGWLVSIGMSATRFYGFRIDKHERGLLLTHGLLTQFRTVVTVWRIQSVRIV